MGGGRAGLQLAFAIATIGCGPAPRDGVDAPSDDWSLCGNGRVDEPLPDHIAEQCDEGARNGTAEARCTKQCRKAFGAPPGPPPFHVDLGPPIAGFATLPTSQGYAFATYSHDDGSVRVWQADPGTAPNPRLLQVAAPVVGLNRLDLFRGPAWIEHAAGTSPHLYVADYTTSDPPTIRELPYPFPEGVRPEFVGVGGQPNAFGMLIVDQSPAGELLIAMVIPRSPTDVVAFPLRVPAPPGTRGITVATVHGDVDDPNSSLSRRLVVFFDDPGSFVSINVRFTADSDPLATLGTVELAEVARGSWPSHVVAGDAYIPACLDSMGTLHPVLRELAVLTDAGDIFLWPFEHGLGPGETFPAPFAHVSAGARALQAYYYNMVRVLQPDGSLLVFTDGDPCDRASHALAPSSIQFTAPSDTMLLPAGSWGEGSGIILATAGGVLYYL